MSAGACAWRRPGARAGPQGARLPTRLRSPPSARAPRAEGPTLAAAATHFLLPLHPRHVPHLVVVRGRPRLALVAFALVAFVFVSALASDWGRGGTTWPLQAGALLARSSTSACCVTISSMESTDAIAIVAEWACAARARRCVRVCVAVCATPVVARNGAAVGLHLRASVPGASDR